MMPNRHATWRDEYVTMIDDCKKRSEILTDWERVTAYRPQIAATEMKDRY